MPRRRDAAALAPRVLLCCLACTHGLRAPAAGRRRLAPRAATLATAPPALAIGAQGLDWPNIGFEYRSTRSFAHYRFRDGEWDAGPPMEYQSERATWWGAFRVVHRPDAVDPEV